VRGIGRVLTIGLLVAGAGASTAAAAGDEAASVGRWSAPFVEPPGDGQQCVEEESAEHDGTNTRCKPAAGSLAVLDGRDVLYWDALEDTEEVELSVAAEFGTVSVDDQSRVLHLDGPEPTWSTPTPGDTGISGTQDPLLPPPLSSEEAYNDGALFCAALTFLPDGRLLAVGGTAYYQDPAVASKYGLVEIQGTDLARIFDPATERWHAATPMKKGRWYPTAVPMAHGDVFVAGGARRLIKPVYPDDPANSGRNIPETETYRDGGWTLNPPSANRSLPLYPRLHLLPGNVVYFNAAGQVFNPMGFAYDEVLWNQAAVYDPATQSWTDLGVPGLGTTSAPGFRGSTFSVMLTLRPEDGYRTARLLTAGGIVGTSPGTYFAVTDSRIDTVDTRTMSLRSTPTGPLQQPRWYGTGVLLPTGEVLAFSGATADEVDGPGTAMPVTTPELFDPATNEWRMLTPSKEARTYHSTAALLPDGRVLVGGHAPVPTLYTRHETLVPGVTSPQEGRNPTFEIYSPPYLARGPRPVIDGAPNRARPGDTLPVTLDIHGDRVDSVVLLRRTAITHLIDGGQRAVELAVVDRKPNRVTVELPSDPSVLPPGPYLLFVNGTTEAGPVPSVAEDLTVLPGGEVVPAGPPAPSPVDTVVRDLDAAGAVPVEPRLAFHEIAELAGHSHDHGSHDHDRPLPWWPLPAAAAAGVALLTPPLWSRNRRMGGVLTTKRVRLR
jgi:hypothetical protein